MKKALPLILLMIIVAHLGAVITETGSLSGFIYGNEPNSAYDNWLSHVSEGIASANYNLYAPFDRQTNGFGDFRIANTTELADWTNVINLFTTGLYDEAQAAIETAAFPYQVVQFIDTDTNRTYYLLRETLSMIYYDDNGTADEYDDENGSFAYGWGLYISNPQATRPVIVTIPHPCDDFSTVPLGIESFKLWDAKYILFNGAGREVKWTNQAPFTNTKSLSDPTRIAAHPYNKAYQAFADDIRSQFSLREFSPQIHSYDWNRHEGMANLQISAGYQKYCPNLPIRDLSRHKNDLIHKGSHLVFPANSFGIHSDVYHEDYYSVFYSTHAFTYSDGVNEYPVNDQITLPAYSQNQQMIYTLSGWTDYDSYDPFFHIEMDELPNCYEQTENNLKWFYGWNQNLGRWDYSRTHDMFIAYYWKWVSDLNDLMDDLFEMNDESAPTAPTNLVLTNPSLNSVTLSWNRCDDYDFDSYEVLYATQPIGTDNFQIFRRNQNAYLASQAAESITVTGLNNANTYYFALRAKDKNGNFSIVSNQVSTALAPANITSIYAHGMDDAVRLSWNVSGQTANQGFKIYRRAGGGWETVDSWLNNPALAQGSSSYEWWDNNVDNNNIYMYKISSTNNANTEYIHNVLVEAMPVAIHTIYIRNAAGTAQDSISFAINPFAGDGQDSYWDVSKGNPSGSNYVWNAFWQQYWGSSGTSLAREVKGFYDLDEAINSWVMRVRSDIIGQNLYIEASDNFGRAEKLYLQDGATWHDLSTVPYGFSVANTNVRTMNLFWGNLQPKATIGYQPNRIYQGGTTASFSWSYTYPFLVDHADLKIINAINETTIAENLTTQVNSFNYLIPQTVDLQSCKLAVDVTAIDGVVTRFISSYTFGMVPAMSFVSNMEGYKMRSNPWPESLLSVTDVFGNGATAVTWIDQTPVEATDFLHGMAYWINNPEPSFYSTLSPVLRDEVSYPIYTGWNFVPNPHLHTYHVKDIRFVLGTTVFTMGEMLSQGLISPAVYVFRNGMYQQVDMIEPCEAFFVKYYGLQSLEPQINFLPYQDKNAVYPIAPDWEMMLKVTDSSQYSDHVTVGTNALATDDYDFYYDLPKSYNMPANMAYLRIEREAQADSTYTERHLARDFVSGFGDNPEATKIWSIAVWSPSAEPLNFDIQTLNIPETWTVTITLNGISHNLYDGSSFSYLPEGEGWIEGTIKIRNFYVFSDEEVIPAISSFVNYPNPFNPSTTIRFNLAEKSPLKLDIYNIRGQLVNTLCDEMTPAGMKQFVWNGRDFGGRAVGSGIYFAKISTNRTSKTLKMMLIK